VSLFTKVPVDEALTIIKDKFKAADHIVSLSRHCMNSTYFMYDSKFYKQVQGAPMGSPLSPVIANLFMDDFETKALESAPLKPRCWYRYVDDTFVIWQHGMVKLQEFLLHLNNIHEKIKFTMELESDQKLPFLDVLVYRKHDGSLGHTVYRKATHTNRYLHATSHHHPTQIRSVANTLAIRSRRIADSHSIATESKSLQDALLQNGYTNRVFHKAWNRALQTRTEDKTPNPERRVQVFLPYVKGTTDRIAKLLSQNNITTIFNTNMKIGALLKSGKDNIDLEGRGVYEVPCGDCNQTYIGQTGRNMTARLQEHRLAVRRDHTTSSLAEHVRENEHLINFSGMRCLSSVNRFSERFVREAIEIEKRPFTMNKRDDGQRLSTSWIPVVASIEMKPVEPTEETRRQARNQPPLVDKRKKTVPENELSSGPATSTRMCTRSSNRSTS
jgi:hypothetical protein